MTDEADAYTFLEIEPAVVAAAPRVSHLFRHIPGGEAGVWEMLEACDSPDARKLLEVRHRLTRRQFDAVPFEAIALAAGMSTKHAFGVVSEAVIENSQDASKLILHAAAPEIMQKAVEHAKGDGVVERGKLLQAVGLLPRSKNTTTIINGDVVKGNKQTLIMPAVADTSRRLGTRFGVEMAQGLLPEPVQEVTVIEPDEDENDDD